MRKFTFIDLFAGIGGFHLAMHELGGKCVFASEIDTFARKTYEHNFKSICPEMFHNNMYNDDIRKIAPSELPDFDVLCAGFPCQPFSQAGHKRGFDDTHKSERGNLFFNIVDIIDSKRPKAFFLENVRGIVNHDNGRTFKIIREILQDELGYSFHYKIVKASDYGLPQLRPRTFMIGFRDEGLLSNFEWPEHKPLKFTMSDVWGGECNREIGFTLRVGGRGSNINDRRNWDSYIVNGEVRKLMPTQAIRMQGFPEEFEFPVPSTQAMKQLGNSVAVDAIRECGKALIEQMEIIKHREEVEMVPTKNKGEWTEIYTFLKLLRERHIALADKNLRIKADNSGFKVNKVSTLNIQEDCFIKDEYKIRVKSKNNPHENIVDISHILTPETLSEIAASIKAGSGTFQIPACDIIQNKLGISIIKGGNSNQKADILLDIENNDFCSFNEGFGIKSYLGSKPTLLNASGNTNFVYEIQGLDAKYIDEINSIVSGQKLKSRINKIHELGGSFEFSHVESEALQYNLQVLDSSLPEIISKMLLQFYLNRDSKLKNNLSNIAENNLISNTDLNALEIKVKRLLVAILLGFFAGKKWDGKYSAKGTIIVKDDGSQVAFHIVDLNELEDYLYENISFDTPSMTRHRFGSVIIETNKKLYFKLNMQLRF